MYYEQHGKGEDLILVSGLSADHTTWKHTILNDLTNHYKVSIFDNRGVGRTDAPAGNYTTAQMAEDTVALMDALKIDKAHILGHSMGGQIVRHIAAKSPERVNKVMVSCSRANNRWRRLIDASEINNKLLQLGAEQEYLLKNVCILLFGENFLSDSAKVKAFIDYKLNSPYPQAPEAYLAQYHALITDEIEKINQQLAQQKNSIMIFGGDEDTSVPIHQLHALKKQISHAQLVIFDECGHMPQYEIPQKYVEEILKFLQ